MSSFITLVAPDVLDTASKHLYERQTGVKHYYESRFQARVPTEAAYNAGAGASNGAGQKISFFNEFTSNFFDFSEAYLALTVSIVRRDDHTEFYPATNNFAFLPEALFSSGSIKWGANSLDNGSRRDIHLVNHLIKNFEYSREYARGIERHEAFYPDTGTDARPNRAPFAINGTTVGADGARLIDVTAAGAAGARDVALSNAIGEGPIQLVENPLYNRGYVKRKALFNGTAAITPVSFIIKLKHLFPVLNALSDLKTGVKFDLELVRNEDQQCFAGAGDPAAGGAGQLPKVFINDIKLVVPSYQLDPTYQTIWQDRMINTTVTRRVWQDIQVEVHPTQIAPGSLETNVQFVGVLNRRPVALFLAYRYANEIRDSADNWTAFNGNTFRYINPGVQSIKCVIGNDIQFPLLDRFSASLQGANYHEIYREFLKVTRYWKQTKTAPMIDYETFINHKFLIPIDCREIDETKWVKESNHNIKFEIRHSAIPAAANTTATGAPRAGAVDLILFMVTEREIIVTESTMGTSIQYDVLPIA